MCVRRVIARYRDTEIQRVTERVTQKEIPKQRCGCEESNSEIQRYRETDRQTESDRKRHT